MGQETSTEGSRDPMTSAVLTCVHAGRRVPQGRMHTGRGGGQTRKKTNQNHKAPPEGVKHRASRQRGKGKEPTVQKRGRGGPRKKTPQVARWGIGTGTGASGGGARRKGPQQFQKETHHPNERGREGSYQY